MPMDTSRAARYPRPMPVKLDAIARLAASLPGAAPGERHGRKTWMVNERGFAWERPFSKADLKRYGGEAPPDGDILAVSTGDLDEKDALLALKLPGFFTIPHFNGYPAVLIQLKAARAGDVRTAVREAWRRASQAPPPRARKRGGQQAGRTRRPPGQNAMLQNGAAGLAKR